VGCRYNFCRAALWGCTLPDGVKPDILRSQGAVVLENPLDVPFKAFRAFMYRQEELAKDDATIYQWSVPPSPSAPAKFSNHSLPCSGISSMGMNSSRSLP
jgi:hypothetical protein